MAKRSHEKGGDKEMSFKRHADQLRKSVYDPVYHNARARILRKWQRGEITMEQVKEEREMLERDLEVNY